MNIVNGLNALCTLARLELSIFNRFSVFPRNLGVASCTKLKYKIEAVFVCLFVFDFSCVLIWIMSLNFTCEEVDFFLKHLIAFAYARLVRKFRHSSHQNLQKLKNKTVFELSAF